MIPFILTPAAGKRLIARAVAMHDAVRAALQSGTVAVVAGTTNGYVAEELLKSLGQEKGFARNLFFRGITLPHWQPLNEGGHLPGQREFPGDVILVKGVWQRGKTLFDVVDTLGRGDVILKGANAVNLSSRRAAVMVAHRQGGTILAALQAVVGRRARLILPVGVEKRVPGDLDALALRQNGMEAQGPRILPVPGEIVTELDSIRALTGCEAEILAGGGVCGAEGAVWLSVSGREAQERAVSRLLEEVSGEPLFTLFE